jgi:hypothetical protein
MAGSSERAYCRAKSDEKVYGSTAKNNSFSFRRLLAHLFSFAPLFVFVFTHPPGWMVDYAWDSRHEFLFFPSQRNFIAKKAFSGGRKLKKVFFLFLKGSPQWKNFV